MVWIYQYFLEEQKADSNLPVYNVKKRLLIWCSQSLLITFNYTSKLMGRQWLLLFFHIKWNCSAKPATYMQTEANLFFVSQKRWSELWLNWKGTGTAGIPWLKLHSLSNRMGHSQGEQFLLLSGAVTDPRQCEMATHSVDAVWFPTRTKII